jgi:hypothetical protein
VHVFGAVQVPFTQPLLQIAKISNVISSLYCGNISYGL